MDKTLRQFVKERIEEFKRQLAAELETKLAADEYAELVFDYRLSIQRKPKVEVVSKTANVDGTASYRCNWKKGQRRGVTDEKVSPELIKEVLKLSLRKNEKQATEALLASDNQELSPKQLRKMGFVSYLDFLHFDNVLRSSGLKVAFKAIERGVCWDEQSYRFFCVKPGTISLPLSEWFSRDKKTR